MGRRTSKCRSLSPTSNGLTHGASSIANANLSLGLPRSPVSEWLHGIRDTTRSSGGAAGSTGTFGLTAAELGLLTSLYLWPFAFMQPVAGVLTDRLGSRRSVTVFLTIAGLGQLLLAASPGFGFALLGRVCTGIGTSILYVAAAKIMAQWFRRRQFGTLTGAWTSFANLGGIIAAAPLAALVVTDRVARQFCGDGLDGIGDRSARVHHRP